MIKQDSDKELWVYEEDLQQQTVEEFMSEYEKNELIINELYKKIIIMTICGNKKSEEYELTFKYLRELEKEYKG